MPAGSEWKGRWWARKSRLEQILLGVISLAIIIIIILLILILIQPTQAPESCSTNTCLSEASKIAHYVDPDVNPCENFYKFACGNFLKNAHGNEQLALPHKLQEQGKWELLEAYSDPIKDDEHKIVRAAKNVFQACMLNRVEMEGDKLKTIKDALYLVGGWPVVEGFRWKEASFDWLNATYKLRDMGYHYKVFLGLSVEPDPDNATQFIFKVATPFMWDYSSHNFDKNEFMTEVATQFGARPDQAMNEGISSIHHLLTQLQREAHSRYSTTTYSKYTVEQYQQLCKPINWLEFINSIAGPAASISKTDFVLFPPPETLRSWINLISRTSKRAQANYMMWKVIEETIPFLPDSMQMPNQGYKRPETREEFCLREIQERFTPSPIDVMCDRRYLPVEKRQKVEEFALSIKSELVRALEYVGWMDEEGKHKAVETAKSIRLVVGHPEDYFDDKILDDLDVDMVDVQSDSFLGLIAQVNRNRQTILFNQIKRPKSPYEKWYIKSAGGVPVYDEKDNVLFIPTVATGGLIYDESKPEYLNYGAMGAHIGRQLGSILMKYLREHTTASASAQMWSNQTKQEAKKVLKCMEKEKQDYDLEIDFSLSVGGQLSYAAYEEWTKNNAEELKLIRTDYTPKQLFWISLASTYCQPVSRYGSVRRLFKDQDSFATMMSGSMRHHPELARDFECPMGSKMNPSSRCKIM